MLIGEYNKLLIDQPYDELNKYTAYGDFVTIDTKVVSVYDLPEIHAVLEEQCEESLSLIKKETKAIPIAIYFYSNKDEKEPSHSILGWKAWTNKKIKKRKGEDKHG